MKHKRGLVRIGILFCSLLFVLVVVAVIFLGPYSLRVQHIKAQPLSGFHADYYLYVSPKVTQLASKGKPVVILVQPNNSGNSDDPKFHQKDAWWMCFGRHRLANELGVALLVPAFIRPAEDWHIYTHALDLDVFTTTRVDLKRIDLQLIAMVEHTRATLQAAGIATHEKILLQGYSASGMFANRFATLHPDRILAVASGSPGGWPIAPVTRYKNTDLPYPAGIANLDELTGMTFDSVNYRSMPQLIVMGSLDDNDSLPYTDGWEEETAAEVNRLFGAMPLTRWEGAKSMYRLGNATVRFELVDGIGHDRKGLQYLTTEFFQEILDRIRE
jgi:pimeloyl-ACP methyl ester carboxylesterase